MFLEDLDYRLNTMCLDVQAALDPDREPTWGPLEAATPCNEPRSASGHQDDVQK